MKVNVRISKPSAVDDVDLEQKHGISQEEMEHQLHEGMKLADKLLEKDEKAKYKLELFFGRARSITKPTPGILHFWESGSQLHGGGDAKIYFCPGKNLKVNECEAVIPFSFNAYGFCVCTQCKKSWKGEDVIGEVFGVLTMKKWAELLVIYMRKLNHNCDIYLKHSPDDIRSVAMREQQKQYKGELLEKARKRALHVYPMKHIIKDTSAGADLTNRIFTFLTA